MKRLKSVELIIDLHEYDVSAFTREHGNMERGE